MRFLADGPDVPDDLIRAAHAGQVTFLCGAGISIAAGLPDFKKLTENVYARLGENPSSEAPERRAIEREEYDRALRAFEKRTHAPGSARSRVREAVAEVLEGRPDVDLPRHLVVMQLSADADGRARVLTTNFDTLFERAARGGVPSHATKALPKPGGARDYGVLHLHGRIADPSLGLEATDLVLTSADFGDAYLRDGWASQYIEDRMRIHRMVLLGYRAEDSAFRLLLETLDVDRERFPDLKPVYALEKAAPDSAALWKAKGIISIEFASYDAVYATLAEWARYEARPADYARERITAMLLKSPEETTDFEREQLRFFISVEELPANLAVVNPSLAWLPALAQLDLIRFDEQRLGSWLAAKFAEPQAVRDVAAHIHMFGPDVAETLEFQLNDRRSELPDWLVKSWRLMIRVMHGTRRGLGGRDWSDIEPRLRQGEASIDLFRRVGSMLKPRLTIGKRLSLREETREPKHASDVMRIEYKSEEHLTGEQVVAAWPAEAPAKADADLLSHLTSSLNEALLDAKEVGVEEGVGWGRSDFDMPSIAAHKQNAYRSGFQEIARVMADLSASASGKGQHLGASFHRHLDPARFPSNPAACAVCCRRAGSTGESRGAGDDDAAAGGIVSDRCQRRGASPTEGALGEPLPAERQAIEARICEGPPRDWFTADARVDELSDRCRFDLLAICNEQVWRWAILPPRCSSASRTRIRNGRYANLSKQDFTAGPKVTAVHPEMWRSSMACRMRNWSTGRWPSTRPTALAKATTGMPSAGQSRHAHGAVLWRRRMRGAAR